jgi:DNA polymerase-1
MRRRGKTINFSVLYGKTDFGLARELGVSQAEARQYIDAYFRRYPRVRELNERILAEARETGRVCTMFGRKRWIPELGARDRNVRMNAERAAFNAPLQGSAADIIKLAMIRLEALLGGSSSQMILQVHDELVFEVPEGEVEAVASLARREMEGVCRLSVPLVVDVKAGPNWRDMSPCSAG